MIWLNLVRSYPICGVNNNFSPDAISSKCIFVYGLTVLSTVHESKSSKSNCFLLYIVLLGYPALGAIVLATFMIRIILQIWLWFCQKSCIFCSHPSNTAQVSNWLLLHPKSNLNEDYCDNIARMFIIAVPNSIIEF